MNELANPFSLVDTLMQDALDRDDPYVVLVEVRKLLDAKELVGKTLAKSLYLLHQSWYNFSLSGQESFNDIINASLNLTPGTVQRYVKLWHHMKELPESIQSKPTRELIPITNALSQGYEFDEDDWDNLERATSLNEIQKIVTTDVKGQEPRKSGLRIYLEQDGSLVCWYQDERYAVGYLDVKSSDDPVERAINRICNSAGVIEK